MATQTQVAAKPETAKRMPFARRPVDPEDPRYPRRFPLRQLRWLLLQTWGALVAFITSLATPFVALAAAGKLASLADLVAFIRANLPAVLQAALDRYPGLIAPILIAPSVLLGALMGAAIIWARADMRRELATIAARDALTPHAPTVTAAHDKAQISIKAAVEPLKQDVAALTSRSPNYRASSCATPPTPPPGAPCR